MDFITFNKKISIDELKGRAFLFHGKEAYMMERIVDKLRTNCLNPAMVEWNFIKVDGEKVTFSDLVLAASTYPMMDELKIIIIQNFDELFSGGWELEHQRFFEKLEDYTCIVGVDYYNKIKKTTKLYKFFKKNKGLVEFNQLTFPQFKSFLEARFKEEGLSLNPSLSKRMFESSGYGLRNQEVNLFDLAQAVSLLGSYCNEGEVTEDALELFWPMDRHENVFKLIELLHEGDRVGSWKTWHDLHRQNESEYMVLAMLIRNLRLIYEFLNLKAEGYGPIESREFMGIKPYEFQQISNKALGWKREKIEALLLSCLKAEKKMKSQTLDSNLMLEVIMSKILTKK